MPIGQDKEIYPLFRFLTKDPANNTKQGFLRGLFLAVPLRVIQARLHMLNTIIFQQFKQMYIKRIACYPIIDM